MLIENKEEMAKVNKDNCIILSNTGIERFTLSSVKEGGLHILGAERLCKTLFLCVMGNTNFKTPRLIK